MPVNLVHEFWSVIAEALENKKEKDHVDGYVLNFLCAKWEDKSFLFSYGTLKKKQKFFFVFE